MLVGGGVSDEDGPPVAGAGLRIDGELVFSDSGGAFFLRRKKAKLYPLEVLPNQFMLPGRFEVVSAPEVVRAEREQMAEIYEVRSEEHTSELQSQSNLVCRLLLEKKKKNKSPTHVD